MTGNQTPPAGDPNAGQSLYKKREKIYARQAHGTFARLRLIAMVALLGLYYALPWLDWNGHQAVLFDLPARKFYIFNWTFWPQDFFYLSMLLIAAALALFFFTALAGRLWCGYACPQTVWTEIYMWFEYRIEGDRKAQMALDKAPMSAGKFTKKATKQVVWLLFSLWTGFTFVGYFSPIQELWQNTLTWSLGPWETFWIFFYSLATYGNAGFLREQVCIYMCPYARFQSAMFDKNTLIISYDEARGEPRGPRKKSVDPQAAGLGDCIDCTLCVQVCPTGIDIRNGLQYQCIGCAACVDVCDEVMEKVGYPKGLVRYTTENALMGKPAHVLRPRVILYGSLILFIFVSLFYLINTRVPLEVDILRDRNALYFERSGGVIENVYTLKLINMENSPQTYEITVDGIPGLEIEIKDDLVVGSGAVKDVPARLRAMSSELESASSKVFFTVKSTTNPDIEVTEHGRFLGPVKR